MARPRSNAIRTQDRNRQARQARKRTAGRPGKSSAKTIQKRQDTITMLKDQSLNLLHGCDLPGLTANERCVAEILIRPESQILTNNQIADLAGCHRDVVGTLRESARYYKAIAESDLLQRRLARLEDKAYHALERGVDNDDIAAAKLVLTLAGRLEQAKSRNTLVLISDRDLAERVDQTVNRMLAEPANSDQTGPKQASNGAQADDLRADFEIIQDDNDDNTDV